MRRQAWIVAVLGALIAATWACGGEPPCSEPGLACFLRRFGPAGGWCPYGGGLLNWWDPHCFPPCGGPNDYCRKSLPCVCWRAYPSYYIWGPPEVCCPQSNCRQAASAPPGDGPGRAASRPGCDGCQMKK
jgi:hypothetical protein